MEAFGEIDDGLATGEVGEALRDEAGGGEAAGGGDVLAAAVGLFFGEAHAESEVGVAGVFHGVGLEGGEEAFIGGKLLEDAEAGGGFIDGDEVAQGLAGVVEAGGRKAEIVDQEGDRGGGTGRRPPTQRALEIFWRLLFW